MARARTLPGGLAHGGPSQSPPDDPRRPAWDILERYYFRHAHVPLCGAGIAGTFLAFSLAVYGEAAIAPRLAPVLASASYVVMLAVIVVNGAILARWRSERDKALGETYAPLGL